VMDVSGGPEWSQWFVGGKLNIAHNCLDRWSLWGQGFRPAAGLLPGVPRGTRMLARRRAEARAFLGSSERFQYAGQKPGGRAEAHKR